jgi:hypothetical protein
VERRGMKDFCGTLESRIKPGTGFAFTEIEEKSLFMKEPGRAEGVKTFNQKGSRS